MSLEAKDMNIDTISPTIYVYPSAALKSNAIANFSRAQLADLALRECKDQENSLLDNKTLSEHCNDSNENFFKVYNSSRNSSRMDAVMDKCKKQFTVIENKSCNFSTHIFKYVAMLCDFSFINEILFFVDGVAITVFIVLDEVHVEKTSQIAYAILDYETSVDDCCFEHVYFEDDELSDDEKSQATTVFIKKAEGA